MNWRTESGTLLIKGERIKFVINFGSKSEINQPTGGPRSGLDARKTAFNGEPREVCVCSTSREMGALTVRSNFCGATTMVGIANQRGAQQMLGALSWTTMVQWHLVEQSSARAPRTHFWNRVCPLSDLALGVIQQHTQSVVPHFGPTHCQNGVAPDTKVIHKSAKRAN
jgi:hypothetical protein